MSPSTRMQTTRSRIRGIRGIAPFAFALLLAGHSLVIAATPIELRIDATDIARKIVHASESIPAQPGPLTLLYPKWVPGNHRPSGPIVDLTGIRILADGQELPWRRDLENPYALHLEVPAGASGVEVSFDFLPAGLPDDSPIGASSSAKLAVLNWHQLVLYPEQVPPASLMIDARLRLPATWQAASALTVLQNDGDELRFKPVSLIDLVDSPVLAGAHLSRIQLTPANQAGPPVYLDLASDNVAALAISAEQKAGMLQLVREAHALFGAWHFERYELLYALSDHVAPLGLEHHQSADVRVAERSLIDDDLRLYNATLAPHELVHSWNGKYRRPAGLATGDFSSPMKGDLLWVYEGLTEYLGDVLAARSGLLTPEQLRDYLALVAAALDNRPGRDWRPLQDTADAVQVLRYARRDGDSWRRRLDYYDEGSLLWLEADVTIRELSRGRRSLDDFCRAFFGAPDSGPIVLAYELDDVVNTLNQIAPFDWRGFFRERVEQIQTHPPLGGLEKSGWRLVYKDSANSMLAVNERVDETSDFRFSLGFSVRADQTLTDVIPGSPAARAGLAAGMTLVAVNSRSYSSDILQDALRLGKRSADNQQATTPLDLLAVNNEFYQTYALDYHGGDRYPALERDSSRADVLSDILKPRVAHTARKVKVVASQ